MELRAAQLNNESAMEMREREIRVQKRKRSSSSTWASKSPYVGRAQPTPSGRRCPKDKSVATKYSWHLEEVVANPDVVREESTHFRDKKERSEISHRLFLTENQTLSQQTNAAPDNRDFPQM